MANDKARELAGECAALPRMMLYQVLNADVSVDYGMDARTIMGLCSTAPAAIVDSVVDAFLEADADGRADLLIAAQSLSDVVDPAPTYPPAPFPADQDGKFNFDGDVIVSGYVEATEVASPNGVAGDGEDLSIRAGDGVEDNTDGGDVVIAPGSGGSGGANGNVLITLPTADPVVAGALWNDSGTVKVSSGS